MPANRKGARRVSDVSDNLRAQLSAGEDSAGSLMEWFAVDQPTLLERVLHDIERADLHAPLSARLSALTNRSSKALTETIGAGLLAGDLTPEQRAHIFNHPSDSVRSWAAYMVGADSTLTLPAMLDAIRPLAADTHWGVREFAWLAVRPSLGQSRAEIIHALDLLTPWVTDADANIRRFASELTRPRGVWCKHIGVLRADPALSLGLLTPLHADPSRYVQDSVANWLNDASKDAPDWVRGVCADWKRQSDSKATAYIIRRALRTLNKADKTSSK